MTAKTKKTKPPLSVSSLLSRPAPATAPAAPKPQKLFPGAVKIVAVVNGEILTTEDLENRVNAFVMNTRIPVNDQTRNMIVQRTLPGSH